MKTTLTIALLLATTGCTAARAFIGANPEAVAAGAIYAEQRVGSDCAARTQAGTPADSARVTRLLYARIGANVTVLANMGGNLLGAVNQARELTDQLCGVPARAPLTELPAPVAVPAQ